MAEKTSYIRIDRNIIHWRWWHDHNTLVVFLYLIIQANIVEHGFSGQIIRRGQVVTSLSSLCNSTGLTISQVRTALQHLKMTGEIASKTFSKFQVITVINYDKYQDLTGKNPYKSQSDRKQIASRSQHLENGEKERRERREKGRSAPRTPSGKKSMPGRDEGTADDIPEKHRDRFKTYAEYFDWRNQ